MSWQSVPHRLTMLWRLTMFWLCSLSSNARLAGLLSFNTFKHPGGALNRTARRKCRSCAAISQFTAQTDLKRCSVRSILAATLSLRASNSVQDGVCAEAGLSKSRCRLEGLKFGAPLLLVRRAGADCGLRALATLWLPGGAWASISCTVTCPLRTSVAPAAVARGADCGLPEGRSTATAAASGLTAATRGVATGAESVASGAFWRPAPRPRGADCGLRRRSAATPAPAAVGEGGPVAVPPLATPTPAGGEAAGATATGTLSVSSAGNPWRLVPAGLQGRLPPAPAEAGRAAWAPGMAAQSQRLAPRALRRLWAA
mmetsp:Transcript_107905/g.240768  ORF Transcript_107905/g.240768 Transcript_107905/m.240768 type:complete len:314 (+) Transcript_107905:1051-1992(+)